MRVLVAGGAGFIGSHLCRRLLSDNHQVVCIDDLSTGRLSNICDLTVNPNFTFRNHDVTTSLSVDVGAVFQLASPASPPGYLKRPIETLRVNSEGTRQLLETSRVSNARFLLASTSEIYGDPLEHPQREDHWGNVNPVGERSCYDEGKRFAEAITTAYSRTYGVDCRIIRIFNTYGPASDPCDGRLVPNFVTQALRGGPLTIFGDGRQTRSLCFVGDLVEGLMRAMFSDAARNEIINLGNPDERSVREYAERIQALCGINCEIVTAGEVIGDDPRRRRPDITKAIRLLGWKPRIGLDDGLRATIAYFRRELGIGVSEPTPELSLGI
jgi:nucleoside-diphosphate-sugar epimerase